MSYLYYPGCSLEGTAREYDMAARAVMAALGKELKEIDDWTCCGASAAEAVDFLLSLVLPARNLAMAEKSDFSDEVLVPCSSCYLNLKRAREIAGDKELLKKVNSVLSGDDLFFEGRIKVRHILDVLSMDVGPGPISALVKKSLHGLTIAPYYGCQCLRPYDIFDDPEKPVSMESLIKATGAEVHGWDMGGKCCGASHMNTDMDVGIQLVGAILRAAKGADAIVTVCPMCQMNLEAYQKKISGLFHQDLEISILYLPQLLGIAMDIPMKSLGLDMNLALTRQIVKKFDKCQGQIVAA